MEALNSARFSVDSKLKRAENVFFPEHIREVPADLPSTTLPLPPPEQVSSIQDITLNAGLPQGQIGARRACLLPKMLSLRTPSRSRI